MAGNALTSLPSVNADSDVLPFALYVELSRVASRARDVQQVIQEFTIVVTGETDWQLIGIRLLGAALTQEAKLPQVIGIRIALPVARLLQVGEPVVAIFFIDVPCGV